MSIHGTTKRPPPSLIEARQRQNVYTKTEAERLYQGDVDKSSCSNWTPAALNVRQLEYSWSACGSQTENLNAGREERQLAYLPAHQKQHLEVNRC